VSTGDESVRDPMALSIYGGIGAFGLIFGGYSDSVESRRTRSRTGARRSESECRWAHVRRRYCDWCLRDGALLVVSERRWDFWSGRLQECSSR